MRKTFAAILCLILVCVPAGAQDAATPPAVGSGNPGINDRFLDPQLDTEEFTKIFEGESREVFTARNAIIAAVEIKPGDRVADIGAGTGLYTALFSKRVGDEGWVYAVDISPRFVEHIAERCMAAGLDNVTPVLCDGKSARLAPESVDKIFICDTYHHFEYPPATLASLRKALKPGGMLIVVDFERVEGVSRDWTMNHVRAGKEVFKSEIEAAGFEFIDQPQVEGLQENYLLRFRRPATQASQADAS